MALPFLITTNTFSQVTGEDLLQQAKRDFSSNRFEEAFGKATEALDMLKNPEQKADAHITLGLIYQIDNKDDPAKLEFAQAFSLNPSLQLDPDQYYPATIQLFDKAKQEGVNRIQRGDELYDQSMYEEALVQYNAGIGLLSRTSPEKNQVLIVKACLTAAEINQTLQNNNEAIKAFQKALGLNPDLELKPEDFPAITIQLFQDAKTQGSKIVRQAGELIQQKNFNPAIEILEKNEGIYFSKEVKKDAALLLAQAYYSSNQEARALDSIRTLLSLDAAYKLESQKQQTPFGEFFELQKIKIGGRLPKILIVKGSDDVIHDVTVSGFKSEIQAIAGEIKEIGTKNLKKEVSKFAPDAIFASGFEALESVSKAGVKSPVIFANVRQAKATEIKDSNIGGIYLEVSLEEQYSVLRAVLPNAKVVGVLYDREDSATLIDEVRKKASNYNFDLVTQEIGDSLEIEAGLKKVKQADAFATVFDKSFNSMDAWNRFVRESTKRNIPVFAYGLRDFAEKGALFSLSYNFSSIGKQAASLIQKVLLVHPETIPRIYPSFSELAINLAVAKKLNININSNVITKDTVVFK